MLHEFNHFIRRFGTKKNEICGCKTPRDCEGGKQLFYYLFEKEIIKTINLEDANSIININNWNDNNYNFSKLFTGHHPCIRFMESSDFSCAFDFRF